MSTHDSPVPLESQVGGHPGVMTSEDGSLLIKPAHPTEVAFYQSAINDPDLAPLRSFLPNFYGTLRLEGKLDQSTSEPNEGGQIAIVRSGAESETESLVLENLSHSFLKPNILDIKLGTVLYDEDASPEKRARMEQTARETTSFETGVRLTGFQVYDLATGKPITTPKAYGKSIKPADLPDGFARIFPIAPDTLPEPTATSAEGEQPGPSQGTGLPADLLLSVLECLREDIAEIRAALAEVHLRMVGASLLVIYEADWERTRVGLKWFEEGPDKEEDGEERDGEEEVGGEEVGEEENGEEEVGEEEDDDDEEAEGKKRMGPPYLVKLIDFAHTKVVPGMGPDERLLKGVDTVLNLLDGRIKEVKNVIASKVSEASNS